MHPAKVLVIPSRRNLLTDAWSSILPKSLSGYYR